MITQAVAPWVNNAAWQAPPTTPHQSGCAPPVESWRGEFEILSPPKSQVLARTIGLLETAMAEARVGFHAQQQIYRLRSVLYAQLSLRRVILTPSYPYAQLSSPSAAKTYCRARQSRTRVLPMSKREDDIGRAKNCA